ncbi:MAG: flavoprotein [Planctomycetota bacterium]
MDTTVRDLQGRRMLVGVTGGIAAFKTAALVSTLAQRGAEVTVAMTEAATRFVSAQSFAALAGRPVITDIWSDATAAGGGEVRHIAVADAIDVALVAPCSMDCLARLATGRADDPVALILAATDRARVPVLLSPSMNRVMLAQPSTQRNIAQLRGDGFVILDAESGWQACRHVGPGRMPEPETLMAAIDEAIARRQ